MNRRAPSRQDFNFFVVSASGKAFILFLMLKPLADILRIHQQVVVTIFQLGGVTYQQWLKFAGKIILTLVLIGVGFAFLAQGIGLA